jgi:hypothetical protein
MKHRNEFVTLVSSIYSEESEESAAAQTAWNSASKGGKSDGKSTNTTKEWITTIEWIVSSSTIRLPSRINNWVLLN